MTSTRHFLEQLHLTHLRQSRPPETWRDFTVDWVDMRRMKLGLGAFVPMISRNPDTRATAAALADDLIAFTREKAGSSPTIVVDEDPSLRGVLEPIATSVHSIALLQPATRTAFVEARDHEKRFQILGAALASDIGPGGLTPYQPGKPASGSRFFGRARVIDQIVAGRIVRNCTIVGNRRIGKTSLLYEVKERLSEVYVPGKTIHFASLYANKFRTTWDAVYLTLSQLGIQVPKSWTKLGAIAPRYIRRFPQLIHDFARQRQTYVVILIDEFDSFLALDSQNDWEFLHLLRETAAEDGPCAVVIAGFRLLMQTRIRRDNPYYNFTREIALTPLSKEETIEMVQAPLGRLGIDVSGTGIASFIHKETRGQPELIQMYCQAVISLYGRRRCVPHESELATYVNRDHAFSRTILHTFLKNANPIEQVLCFELMKRSTDSSAMFEFKASDAYEALAGSGLRLGNAGLATLLNNLVYGSFIERVQGAPGHYRFAVPQLVRYCKAVNLEELLERAVAEMGPEPSAEALAFEPPELA